MDNFLKSEFVYNIIVHVITPEIFGGCEDYALLIDCDWRFSPYRLASILKNKIEKKLLMMNEQKFSEKSENDVSDIANVILLFFYYY
jgi:hypothetical protein